MPDVEGYLLDTSVASAAWDKGAPRHNQVRERMETLGDSLLFVSAISIAEVEYGLQVAPALDASRQYAVRDAMSKYAILEIDRHTAQTYAGIRARLFKAHAPKDRRQRINKTYVEDLVERTSGKELGIQENDLWIVSVAVQYNLVFVTADRGGGTGTIVDAAQYAHRIEYWA
ncbi:MAG: type II toxin-antitoxin system VapC family toxin [Chloroflexi bacterium]|nr:type II toxin-antitoxin system VapC family toxin [Chloroflexota bacterium]